MNHQFLLNFKTLLNKGGTKGLPHLFMNIIRHLAICLSVSLSLGVSSAAETTETNPVYTVHFATDYWPPYFISDENGEINQGVFVELIQAIFKRIPQAQAKIHAMPWTRALVEVRSGRMDGLPGLVYTEARTQHLQFTAPLFKNSFLMVYNKQQFPQGFQWDGPESLKGRKVAAVRGYAMYDKVLKLLDDRQREIVTPVLSDEIVIKMVGSGRISLGVINELTAVYLVEKYDLEDKIEYARLPTAEQDYYIALSKLSASINLTPTISKAIIELREEGTIDRILDQYRARVGPK